MRLSGCKKSTGLIILERDFVMLKYGGMKMKTKQTNKKKRANSDQLCILKRTQPMDLHGPSSARPLRTFISAECWRHILLKLCRTLSLNEQLDNDSLTLFRNGIT